MDKDNLAKWDEWNNLVLQYQRIEQRDGQAYMNALWKVDVEMYERINSTPFDCFYDDNNIDKFLSMLMLRWKLTE